MTPIKTGTFEGMFHGMLRGMEMKRMDTSPRPSRSLVNWPRYADGDWWTVTGPAAGNDVLGRQARRWAARREMRAETRTDESGAFCVRFTPRGDA